MTNPSGCIICQGKTKLFFPDLFDDRYGAPGKYSIYRCVKCGFGTIYPILSKEKIGRFYARYYPLDRLDASQIIQSASVPNRFSTWLDGTDNIAHRYITCGSSVLDIGSASGVSLLEIEKLGGNAFGVEPDPNAKKFAKELELKVYTGFITDNPFPDIKFDFITASQVIEHDPDPKTFLEAVYKKLSSSGVVILSFPNFEALYRSIFGKRWIHWHVPYHCSFFTRKSIAILAETAGFKIAGIKTITPNLWTLLQLRVLFTTPVPGKPSTVWISGADNKTNHISTDRYKNKTFYIINRFAKYLVMPLNRIIDIIGQGESFLVFLKKNNI